MKRALTAVVVVAAGLAACSAPSSDAASFPAEPLTTLKSDDGALTIEVRTSPQPPERGVLAVELTVDDDKGAPVSDLDVTATPWMPEMNHGASVSPTVTPEGEGKYLVENVALFMPGTWQLRTTFAGAITDHATPELSIP